MKAKRRCNLVHLDNWVTSSDSVPFAYASPAYLQDNATLTTGLSNNPFQLLTNQRYIKALNKMSLTK